MACVRKAYDKLDKNKDGQVTLDDIAQIYDASHHPDVKNGRPEEEIFMEFMSQWDTQEKDGIVTFSEFCNYYSDVAAYVPDDNYFEVMMKNAWRYD